MKKLKTIELTGHVGTFMRDNAHVGMMCLMSDGVIEVVKDLSHEDNDAGAMWVSLQFAGWDGKVSYADTGIPLDRGCRTIKGVIDPCPKVEREEIKADPNVLLPTHTPDVQFKDSIIELYIDWRNNFLTVERFASHYGLREADATLLINLGREFHERKARSR